MDPDHSYLNELDGVYPAFQARSRLAQERLLRAGDAVFASKGYDKAHVTDIAAAAGYSIGTFYGRFRDKEALFTALQIRFARRGRANIDRFFDLQRWHDATPAELIETLSAPANSRARMSFSSRTPPPTVSGMKQTSAVRRTTSRMVPRFSWVAVMSRKQSSSAPAAS